MAFGEAGSITRRLAGQLSCILRSGRLGQGTLFDNVAAAVITFFGIAVTYENLWGMRTRHISLGPVDWLLAIAMASLPPASGHFLPSRLKGLIAVLYSAALRFELEWEGPVRHFGHLSHPHGLDDDIFFGSILFIVQVCLLIEYGVGALARLMSIRRRGR